MADNQESSNNGLGIASFVLGIISIVLFFMWYISIILGILAIIFGIIQIKKQKTWQGVTGLILGIIGVILAIIIILIIIFIWAILLSAIQSNPSAMNSFNNSTLTGKIISMIR